MPEDKTHIHPGDVRYIVLPGRHHIITQFQVEYLRKLLETYKTAEVVWAVTSANHGGTQRNPIPGYRRTGMVEAAVWQLDIPSQVYAITNRERVKRFAHYVIEDIRVQSDGLCNIEPSNSIVMCSTPSVIAMYKKMGYSIAPAELDAPLNVQRPWDVVEELIARGSEWRYHLQDVIPPVVLQYYDRYGLAEVIQEVFRDPLIDSDDGDITVTRDYGVYRQAFEENAWRKVKDFSSAVQPGRIVDIGCATGQTIKLLSEQPGLHESDFYGVEVARPLYDICQQRKQNEEFGDVNVFFHQRNIMRTKLFADDTIATAITMALTHEVESYLGRDELHRFLQRTYDMLKPGGVYINYDVVGPERPDELVYVQFRNDDGVNPQNLAWDLRGDDLRDFLARASTETRYRRFRKDFRQAEDDTITDRIERIAGEEYYVLRWADLCDFLAKKDYVDSWTSEMHERFCFYSHQQWCDKLQDIGFDIVPSTRAIQNPWLIEHRFADCAQVYRMDMHGKLVPQDQPDTNTLLVAKKPRSK